jgi:hypothetical protein
VAELPAVHESLLVRTHFGDDDGWQKARDAALSENEDGFRAYATVVDNEAFAGSPCEQLREIARSGRQHASVLFVVDREAMEETYPVLVVDLSDDRRAPFRCAADQLWSVDNNLNLANMDWEEFSAAVDGGGVYRGFD